MTQTVIDYDSIPYKTRRKVTDGKRVRGKLNGRTVAYRYHGGGYDRRGNYVASHYTWEPWRKEGWMRDNLRRLVLIMIAIATAGLAVAVGIGDHYDTIAHVIAGCELAAVAIFTLVIATAD